jgi:D-glycero-D-manno-heptose 1,7-bisphosphate phosphatase
VLDRDGVLNEATVDDSGARSPRTLDEFVVVPDAPRCVHQLHDAGFVVLVATNQPDVARNRLNRAVLEQMHALLTEDVGVDRIYTCPHDNQDGCSCRKPETGLLVRAIAEYDLNVSNCWLIGDRWVDLLAARRAGLRSVLLERDYSWHGTSAGQPPTWLTAPATARTLAGCVDIVLAAHAGG